jgi:hypothetical protein
VGVKVHATMITGWWHCLFLSSRDMESCLSLFTAEESVGDSWKETDPEQHEALGGREDERTIGTF